MPTNSADRQPISEEWLDEIEADLEAGAWCEYEWIPERVPALVAVARAAFAVDAAYWDDTVPTGEHWTANLRDAAAGLRAILKGQQPAEEGDNA